MATFVPPTFVPPNKDFIGKTITCKAAIALAPKQDLVVDMVQGLLCPAPLANPAPPR